MRGSVLVLSPSGLRARIGTARQIWGRVAIAAPASRAHHTPADRLPKRDGSGPVRTKRTSRCNRFTPLAKLPRVGHRQPSLRFCKLRRGSAAHGVLLARKTSAVVETFMHVRSAARRVCVPRMGGLHRMRLSSVPRDRSAGAQGS